MKKQSTDAAASIDQSGRNKTWRLDIRRLAETVVTRIPRCKMMREKSKSCSSFIQVRCSIRSIPFRPAGASSKKHLDIGLILSTKVGTEHVLG